ncbi:MAG: HU family DNA-binding protein [Lachnospiraceae bacterium]|nr:HU family DNA-binding protein [Lachnospiraceae bacterium]
MYKADFIEKVAAKSGATKASAEAVVNASIEVITEALKSGEKVQLTGFGTFEAVEKPAKNGINPKTKAKITIPAHTVPKFKAGKSLKDAVK